MNAILTFLQTLYMQLKVAFTFFRATPDTPSTSEKTDAVVVLDVFARERALKAYYDAAKDPGVTFRVFHLRVTYFDWQMKDALLNFRGIMNLTEFNGRLYSPEEIHSACKNPVVSLDAFTRRIQIHKWGALKALTYAVRRPKAQKPVQGL